MKGLPPDLLTNLEELVTTLCSAKNRVSYHLVVQLLVRRNTIHGHPLLPIIHFFPYPGRLAWSQFTALVDRVCDFTKVRPPTRYSSKHLLQLPSTRSKPFCSSIDTGSIASLAVHTLVASHLGHRSEKSSTRFHQYQQPP